MVSMTDFDNVRSRRRCSVTFPEDLVPSVLIIQTAV